MGPDGSSMKNFNKLTKEVLLHFVQLASLIYLISSFESKNIGECIVRIIIFINLCLCKTLKLSLANII